MRRVTVLSSVILAGLLAIMTSAPMRAATDIYTYDKLAYMTFGGPVQIPWATLAPGTYRFRLANPSTSRNVIQVLSEDGATVYSMFHTTPDSRINTTDEPVVTFRETPAGIPPAVRSLFYGGEHRGYEFVYPKGSLTLTTPAQPEISYTSNEAVAVPEAPVETIEPELLAEVAPSAEVEPMPSEATEPVAELPRTASPLPLVALGGLTSLFLGLGAHLVRRRSS